MSKNPFDIIIDNGPSIIILCAAPKSGKTYMVKYLMNELFKKKKLDYGICFCPTNFTGAYDYLPEHYIHSQYNENTFINFYNIQIEQIKKNKKCKPAFVIFDDCIGSVNFESNKFKKIISTYRHPNLTLIFTTQYIKALPTILRECASFFITFRQSKEISFKGIQENFMNDYNLKEVKKIIGKIPKYRFLLICLEEDDDKKYNFNGKAPDKYKEIKIKY